MQIKLFFKTEPGFSLPFNYNHQLQSGIYRKLGEIGRSDFIHDVGYTSKHFKGFVFGSVNGDLSVKEKKLVFGKSLFFELRSFSYEFCDDIQRSFERFPYMKFFDTELGLSDMKLGNVHINGERAEFCAQTPVIVHKKTQDGKTVYYSPDDEAFLPGLKENFIKKYSALTGKEASGISIDTFGNYKKTVTNYKGTWINAYKTNFIISGDSESLEFIYNTGLGAKNSQGFGMLDLLQS